MWFFLFYWHKGNVFHDKVIPLNKISGPGIDKPLPYFIMGRLADFENR